MICLDRQDDAVHVMPAYWFRPQHVRDGTQTAGSSRGATRARWKEQHIELDYLAPDTVQEMLSAMERLEVLAGPGRGRRPGARRRRARRAGPRDPVRGPGRRAHAARPRRHETVRGGDREAGARVAAVSGTSACTFGVRALLDFFGVDAATPLERFVNRARELSRRHNAERWVNFGGSPSRRRTWNTLRADIVSGKLGSWDAVHDRYDELWAGYPKMKARYALFAIEQALAVKKPGSLGTEGWKIRPRYCEGDVRNPLCERRLVVPQERTTRTRSGGCCTRATRKCWPCWGGSRTTLS